MTDSPDYRGYRFPPEVIARAVWLYHRFTLSFRDVEDLMGERGITAYCAKTRPPRKGSDSGTKPQLIRNAFGLALAAQTKLISHQ